MGWGHGADANGREIGYTVAAVCDDDECAVAINRGLAFRCGSLGTEVDSTLPGCGGYFCARHLFMPPILKRIIPGGGLCGPCFERENEELRHAPYFDCPRCDRRSYNTHDIEEGYCGNCHTFTRD